MDTFGLVALVALYCNGLASNSWYVLVGLAKILELVQLRFWWWSMDTLGLVALYYNGLPSNSWYVLVG